MGLKCSEEENFDKVMPCDLSGDDLVVVAAENEPQHAEAAAEAAKGWTGCSVNVK